MKKIIFCIMLLGICTSTAFAQDNGKAGQQPQQHQRRDFSPEEFWNNLQEYVTREAKLSDEEAAKFYPLLREMSEKQRQNNGKCMKIIHSCNENTTDEEYGLALEQILQVEVENKQIEESYYKQFHAVMSWQKVFEVRRALNQFYREALNRFNPRKGDRQRGPGPNGPGNREKRHE